MHDNCYTYCRQVTWPASALIVEGTLITTCCGYVGACRILLTDSTNSPPSLWLSILCIKPFRFSNSAAPKSLKPAQHRFIVQQQSIIKLV